jgi:uracil-DNA glycosylase
VGGEQGLIGIADARSALSWWLEAGVDVAIQEQPRDWLKPAPARSTSGTSKAAPATPAPEPRPALETLDLFRDWLATSPALPMARPGARRVLPQGGEHAAIMLLAEAPEDPAGPMTGEAWQLAQRMLAAIGIAPEQAYSASISCFHSPGARMTPAERDSCAEIARTHVRLVQPKRLLLFGNGPAQALIGKPLPQARGHVHKVEGVRTVVTFHPRDLIKQPSNKSLAWRDLLLLMEDES